MRSLTPPLVLAALAGLADAAGPQPASLRIDPATGTLIHLGTAQAAPSRPT
jgi:hypothetical protein